MPTRGESKVFPDRATRQFLQLNGEMSPEAASAAVAGPWETIVVSFDGDYWLCTREELEELLAEGWDDSVGHFLADHFAPALVREVEEPESEPGWSPGRIVLTDGGVIEAAVSDGALTEIYTAAAAPPPAAESPGDDLGPTRGGGAPGTEEDQETAESWNLETSFPRQVLPGSVTSLIVELNREASEGPDVSTLPVPLDPGTRVDVVVHAKRGFKLRGAGEGSIVAADDNTPLRFQLEATDEGSGLIRVMFFVEATNLGVITLEPAIVTDMTEPDAPISASAVMSAHSAGPARPDLELLVREEESTGNPRYSILVTSPDESLGLFYREFGPIELRTDTRAFFADLFADIEAMDLGSAEARIRAQKLLEAKGNFLFTTLLPEPLRALLWGIRDRITRIRIDSDEPHIPWELIRLSGPDETGTVIEGKFLCEYEITRWIPGLGLNSRLTLADIGVVIPADSGLASAQEEREFLLGLAAQGREVTPVPTTFLELMDSLAAGKHDVWHFSGHGSVKDDQDPNRAAMQLSDGQKLTPEQISGAQANLGRSGPLVFMNACQIGRTGMSLTGMGGWARQFLGVGAAGFVGAMWNVHDNPARDFARALYTHLLAGETIGAATLLARQEIKRYQDATWLAYTVFGHPSAVLTSGDS
jgi:hypothetical protein